MGTKETSSGVGREGSAREGSARDVAREGDSALTHGALNKDCSAEAFWAATRDCWAREASWAADLRSR